MKDYIISIFNFTNNFFTSDGDILLFHPNNFHFLKEIISYLESYGFEICMKWVIVNSLPLISSKDPSMKVWIQKNSPYFQFFACFIFSWISTSLSYGLWQTLLNRVLFLVRGLGKSSSQLKSFLFSPSFKHFL